MDESEFDRLLEHYQKGLLTGRKKQLVEDWLNSMDKHTGETFTDDDQARIKQVMFQRIRNTSQDPTSEKGNSE